MATKKTIQSALDNSPPGIAVRLINDWSAYEDEHNQVPKVLNLRTQDVVEIVYCHSVLCFWIAELISQPIKDRKLGCIKVVFHAKTYGFE